jgi:hypothetical protein
MSFILMLSCIDHPNMSFILMLSFILVMFIFIVCLYIGLMYFVVICLFNDVKREVIVRIDR